MDAVLSGLARHEVMLHEIHAVLVLKRAAHEQRRGNSMSFDELRAQDAHQLSPVDSHSETHEEPTSFDEPDPLPATIETQGAVVEERALTEAQLTVSESASTQATEYIFPLSRLHATLPFHSILRFSNARL